MSKRLDHARGLYLEGIRDGRVREAIAAHTGERYTQHSSGVRNGAEGFIEFFEPFIERNELGDHGGGCIYTASMLVDESHQIRFYSGASKAEHFQNQDLADAALMLHTMRLDGFVYLATPSGRGTLRCLLPGDTRPEGCGLEDASVRCDRRGRRCRWWCVPESSR